MPGKLFDVFRGSILLGSLPLALCAQEITPAAAVNSLAAIGLEDIDCRFENASPLWYEVGSNRTVSLNLNYDHERSSVNRAAGHIYFQLHGKPGAKFTLEFKNLDNIYNGRRASVADE